MTVALKLFVQIIFLAKSHRLELISLGFDRSVLQRSARKIYSWLRYHIMCFIELM